MCLTFASTEKIAIQAFVSFVKRRYTVLMVHRIKTVLHQYHPAVGWIRDRILDNTAPWELQEQLSDQDQERGPVHERRRSLCPLPPPCCQPTVLCRPNVIHHSSDRRHVPGLHLQKHVHQLVQITLFSGIKFAAMEFVLPRNRENEWNTMITSGLSINY